MTCIHTQSLYSAWAGLPAWPGGLARAVDDASRQGSRAVHDTIRLHLSALHVCYFSLLAHPNPAITSVIPIVASPTSTCTARLHTDLPILPQPTYQPSLSCHMPIPCLFALYSGTTPRYHGRAACPAPASGSPDQVPDIPASHTCLPLPTCHVAMNLSVRPTCTQQLPTTTQLPHTKSCVASQYSHGDCGVHDIDSSCALETRALILACLPACHVLAYLLLCNNPSCTSIIPQVSTLHHTCRCCCCCAACLDRSPCPRDNPPQDIDKTRMQHTRSPASHPAFASALHATPRDMPCQASPCHALKHAQWHDPCPARPPSIRRTPDGRTQAHIGR